MLINSSTSASLSLCGFSHFLECYYRETPHFIFTVYKTHNIIKSGIFFDAKSRCCTKKWNFSFFGLNFVFDEKGWESNARHKAKKCHFWEVIALIWVTNFSPKYSKLIHSQKCKILSKQELSKVWVRYYGTFLEFFWRLRDSRLQEVSYNENRRKLTR